MGTRKDIVDTIRLAIDGLTVTINDEDYTLVAIDTLFDPLDEAELPKVSVTPGIETCEVGLYGMSLSNTLKIDIFCYTFGKKYNDDGEEGLYTAAEEIVDTIKQKLISAAFINNVACSFSIIQIGPIVVEQMAFEEPRAYISMPLTVQYLETEL